MDAQQNSPDFEGTQAHTADVWDVQLLPGHVFSVQSRDPITLTGSHCQVAGVG